MRTSQLRTQTSEFDPKPTFDVLHFLSRLPGELPNCVPIMKGWNYIRPALPPAAFSTAGGNFRRLSQ